MSSPESPSPPASSRSRRGLVYAGIGAAAGLAGIGFALWRHAPEGVERPGSDFWSMQFDSPAGGAVSLQSFRGKPLLLNFWATWCPPCVEEMPLIDAFFRQNSAKSWNVLGLAIDQPSAVRTFLQRTPVTYAIGLAGLGGTELTKTLGNKTGGLPFTVVMNSSGSVVERRMGRLTGEDLAGFARLA